MSTPLAVIKVGGDILANSEQLAGLVHNIAEASRYAWRIVVLHGGGPQVSKQQELLGITPNKVGGRRITSKHDLKVVKQVLCGELNVDLVAALQSAGVNALGCHGASAQLIRAIKRPPRVVEGSDGKPIDFGEVGDVVSINTELLNQWLDAGLVPVIASLACTHEGRVLNINADTTVVNIARSMPADLLVLVTAVGAIFENLADKNSRIIRLDSLDAAKHIKNGAISDGMIPKVEEALELANNGNCEIVVASLAQPGSLLKIAAGSDDIGTRFERS